MSSQVHFRATWAESDKVIDVLLENRVSNYKFCSSTHPESMCFYHFLYHNHIQYVYPQNYLESLPMWLSRSPHTINTSFGEIVEMLLSWLNRNHLFLHKVYHIVGCRLRILIWLFLQQVNPFQLFSLSNYLSIVFSEGNINQYVYVLQSL